MLRSSKRSGTLGIRLAYPLPDGEGFEGCDFHVRLVEDKEEHVIRITQLKGQHVCLGKVYPSRLGIYSSRYLRHIVCLFLLAKQASHILIAL